MSSNTDPYPEDPHRACPARIEHIGLSAKSVDSPVKASAGIEESTEPSLPEPAPIPTPTAVLDLTPDPVPIPIPASKPEVDPASISKSSTITLPESRINPSTPKRSKAAERIIFIKQTELVPTAPSTPESSQNLSSSATVIPLPAPKHLRTTLSPATAIPIPTPDRRRYPPPPSPEPTPITAIPLPAPKRPRRSLSPATAIPLPAPKRARCSPPSSPEPTPTMATSSGPERNQELSCNLDENDHIIVPKSVPYADWYASQIDGLEPNAKGYIGPVTGLENRRRRYESAQGKIRIERGKDRIRQEKDRMKMAKPASAMPLGEKDRSKRVKPASYMHLGWDYTDSKQQKEGRK